MNVRAMNKQGGPWLFVTRNAIAMPIELMDCFVALTVWCINALDMYYVPDPEDPVVGDANYSTYNHSSMVMGQWSQLLMGLFCCLILL